MIDEPFAPEDPYYGHHTLAAKSLWDGTRREVHLLRMAFNYRIVVTAGPHARTYDNGYCFHITDFAWKAFESWDGESEPAAGWVKNPMTGIYGQCPCAQCARLKEAFR